MASTSRVREIIEKTQKKQLMLGNKAVVQGLLEANVGFAAAYPGTPSTEIQMELYKLARKGQLYFEFSVNEKVAAEIAGAAALSGVRSALILKHVGFNVASDTLMALAYFGVKAGMVVIVVDDPGCLSSQNEQDSRLWGKLSHLPVIEPSTIQEVKDCISIAYRLSEKYNTIFLVRLTNFTALNTSEVEFTPINKKLNWDGKFEKDVQHIIPARYILHKGLHEKLELLQDDEMFLQFNSLITKKEENSEKLIVTQGVTYSIVNYLLEHLKIEIPVFKVNAIYPLSEKQWIELLANYKYLYFIEELESYLEDEVAAIIGRNQIPIKLIGRRELDIPEENRIIPDTLFDAFQRIQGDPNDKTIFVKKINKPPFEQIYGREDLLLPRTLPRLCEGCPHRGAFYSIRKAVNWDTIIPSDIGCYALGQLPPMEVGDFWLCMGASIGTAVGFSITNEKPVVAIIGDGTFFHSGIPPLIDAVLYNHNITVAILNNYMTAMTGGQPTPTSPERIAKEQNQIDIEQVVRGLGVKWVKSVRVENVQENVKIFKEAIAYKGPSVVIFNGECIIDLYRDKTDLGKPLYIDLKKCTKCGNCLIEFGCPSIIKKNGEFYINPLTCRSCDVCIGVCPSNAIKK